jgi:hypothetical protein
LRSALRSPSVPPSTTLFATRSKTWRGPRASPLRLGALVINPRKLSLRVLRVLIAMAEQIALAPVNDPRLVSEIVDDLNAK